MTTRTIGVGRSKPRILFAEAKSSTTTRMTFVDTLKVALTALVIAHHAGQAYGPTGGQWPIFSPERSQLLGPFFAVNASFFMGLFFLISGYFLPRAYDRKGALLFLKGRIQRLGIPLLLWVSLVTGPMLYFSGGASRSFGDFLSFAYSSQIPFLMAHLWFVAHLLVYAIGYTLWRQLVQRMKPVNVWQMPVPTGRTLLGYALALAVVTAFVRIWYPIDRWVTLLVVPAEIAHLPQYLSLFIIGIMAHRGDWLRRLPTATGLSWLWIGLFASATRYAYSLGGWQWLPSTLADNSTLVGSMLEAFICVGLSVGLLVLFREWFNQQPGKLLALMGSAAYAAYIVHVLVVVGLQFGLDTVALPPLAKFALVAVVGTLLSFGIGHLVRQLPGANKIL